jgi:glycosyltransferase involved in cell wall biosynthesis
MWMTHNLIPVASFGVYGEALRLGIPVIQFVHNFRPFSPGGSLWLGDRVCDGALHGRLGPELRAGSWQGSVLKTAILAWHVKRLFRSGDLDAVTHWVTISTFLRDKFIEGGIPAERVVALRHSWDPHPAAPIGSDGGYYLLLARLVTEKGVRVTVEAWKRMVKDAVRSCPRLVIGGTGPLQEEAAAAAAECEAIEYRGFVDGNAKNELIANCRAMLAPSVWWEPLGLITYEAYDAAKPVLAAASGGLAETVVEGETGYLHRPGDAEDLIASVRKMEDLTQPERREMGARGREWLLRETDPGSWKERFREILQQAAG